jgi:hypothetical protein
MADITLNSIVYSGSPTNTANPQRPLKIVRRRIKVGKLLTNANGGLTWVHRAFKWEFDLDWGERANQVTETAVLAVRNLTTTTTYVDQAGASFTVIGVGDDSYEETITTDKANAYKYALKLTLREV